MGVTSIQDAKVLISSTKVVDRTAGLKDLVHILKHNRGKSSLEGVTNKAYLALCETLFQCMRDERSSFLHGKAKNSKTAALLPLAANALRHVIYAAVRTIKASTVETIIENIIELLPGKDGSLLKPLLDLPKALRALLEYQPHVERLSQDCWETAVEFCIESLSPLFTEPDRVLEESWSTAFSGRARTPFDSPNIPIRASPKETSSRRKAMTDELSHVAEEFVHCLHMLCKAANAPVLGKADSTLAALIGFLQKRPGRANGVALSAINCILPRITLPKSQLSEQVVRELLSLLRPMLPDLLVRDELMVTLTHSEAHIRRLLSESSSDVIASDLESFVESAYGEYRRRQENTAHQFLEEDHLCFQNLLDTTDAHPLSTQAFSMDMGHARYEGLWATVATIARYSWLLDENKRREVQGREEDEEGLSKRLRITYNFDEYLRHLSEPRSNAKRAALQVLAFMVQEGPIDVEDLRVTIEKLTVYISDENPVHSSWASIALAAAAFQKTSRAPSLHKYWMSVWQSASRTIASLSSSRAACHLMDVLLKLNVISFSTVSANVQSMLLSIELSGPALLTDTSSALMTTIIRERIVENPTNYISTAERILNWLSSKWNPHQWSDRTYTSHNAHHCNARDILGLLHSCLDRPYHAVSLFPSRILGPIAQARSQSKSYIKLSHYLLNLQPEEAFFLQVPSVVSIGNSSPSAHAVPLETKIIEFCIAELEKTRQRWREVSHHTPQSITSDMFRIITNVCIVTAALAAMLQQDNHPLKLISDDLASSFAQLVAKPQTEQYKVYAVLETCAKSLPDIIHLDGLSKMAFKDTGISSLAFHLTRALGNRKETRQSFYSEDDDFMDMDDGPNSQMTAGMTGSEDDIPRHDIAATTEAGALHACCSAYLHLISLSADILDDEKDDIPSEMIEYFVAMSAADLLRCRQFVRSLLHGPFKLSRDECLKLLERLSEVLLDPTAREYNTSEVANCMVVETLVGTIGAWSLDATDRDTKDLYECIEALYGYYAKDIEKNGVRRSPRLQICIADFLHGLLRHHPAFGQNRRVPSVRTSLFDLLAHGELTVKYHIAEKLPAIFEDFVLSEHDNILQDVDSSLPDKEEGWEGIAIGLFVLAKLASRWHTLLRQCVYRIFATAGSVTGVAQHARRCISEVAQARDLGDSQTLFRLFAPQVIYTWLHRKRKFSEIPFTTFGYESLVALLRDIESEAIGQAIMLGLQDELGFITKQLDMEVSEALVKNLSKAAAYTISWDTCNGFARDKSLPSNANLLRDLVGKEQYGLQIQRLFPQVLGYIFQTMGNEERVNKQLEKRAPFNATAKALTEMTNISHSSLDLNIGIEPSFSSYYLFDQLERLCRRTGDNPASFWNANTYTLVMRMLLDRIHPALGSLYARSIIRKIRIVVALAGPVAHEGYPLQMTLQSLWPFLTDIQCAEDTVGIIQYLFEHGDLYLRDHLSFVTGIGLSILISIRSFLGSSQESTTQQSQHTATMSTATRFHAWFTEYLKAYAQTLSARESSSSIKAFRLITMAASQVRIEGNSIRDSEESKLLLEILEDARSGRKLLNKTSREVALNLLCQNFQPASTAKDDVLGSDKDAASYAPFIWDSCRRDGVGDGYLLWVARVLGRAFSAYGAVKQSTAHLHPWSVTASDGKEAAGRTSREAIVKDIIEKFYSDNRREVGLAENAVRLIISRLSGTNASYVEELVSTIPGHIGKALGLHLSETLPPGHSLVSLEAAAALDLSKSAIDWIVDLAVKLCHAASHDPVLSALPKLLIGIKHTAERLFPYIVHLVLLQEFDGEHVVRKVLSEASMAWFSACDAARVPYVRILIQAILYLRSQPLPREVTRVNRDQWLEIEYLTASHAATVCGMYRTALLFAETASGQPVLKSTTRRSSILVNPPKIPIDLQLAIYKNLDEPDSFYGVDQGSSLSSAIDRFDYEGDGLKSLLFRGARLVSQIRRSNALETADSRGFIKSLITINMNSVAHALLSTDQFRDIGDEVVEDTLHTARKLGQWDIKAPETNNGESSTLFKAFQGLHYATDATQAQRSIDQQLLVTMQLLSGRSASSSSSTKTRLRTLGVLSEADEIIRTGRPEHLLDAWDLMQSREWWMRTGEFEDVRQLLSCRETLFSVLSSNNMLLDALNTRIGTVRNMEVEALVSTSTICRRHGALQESLTSVTYLNDIVPDCKAVQLDIETTAKYEEAIVLWEQGEQEKSIRIRQELRDYADFNTQDNKISLPVLLASLGHHVAEARSANPKEIIEDYLLPAIQKLEGQKQGPVPGQVFHEFALFCDKQLQSPGAAMDMERAKTIMDRRYQEYRDFEKLANADKSKGMRDTYRRQAQKAKTWYKLDHAEYESLRKSREQLLRQCLENYLLSLQASDEFNNDALRVFSLWLEHSETSLANEAVSAHLDSVPSGKFALLMNQLSSRLQAEQTEFHRLLFRLVFRICVDHPYHGMHQIFAIQTKVPNYTREDLVRSKDESAKSRQKAAASIAGALMKDKRAQTIWNALFRSNEIYHALAMFKDSNDNRQGREIPLDRYKESKALVEKVPTLSVPPATLQLDVRTNRDYSDLPRIIRFKPKMSIANGLSAPKVITAIGTDGKSYKQLFKSGNDDLRQDAIMEQVFDQVSRLLKNHTATRLRNLGIRTYKVLPLSTRSGLMEFVQNTIPLHQWVMPAHEKYYPHDYKPDKCRKEIGAYQQDTAQARVKVWQRIADNFHPVLRYFLLERFQDPDEWFERRLAYTRSTAAISILGHVLGLGDRHCHNILLDEKSGEVVHIDLGVSFEAGRILPVPEVVPFRLTRDLVDAMGYTKTEGVFRRCCEFTMDTLREERESIMTLLNVLRYDPLVNWSVTPTKAKRMQEQQDTNAQNGGRSGTVGPGSTPAPSAMPMADAEFDGSDKKREEQAGEAGRALSVVEKKLSKTLSTKATVNELIQAATDERNLAVLYMGWASYA